MKKLFFLLILLLAFNPVVLSQGFSVPDQTFTVKVTQKSPGDRPITIQGEELIILGNSISSSFSKKDGFLTAAIGAQNTEQATASATTFTAACTNAKNCALKWTCTINGDKIEGKAEKFFTGKLSGEYVFTGTRKR